MSPPSIFRHSTIDVPPPVQTSPAGTTSSLSERVASATVNRPSDALEVLFNAEHPGTHPGDQSLPEFSAEANQSVRKQFGHSAKGSVGNSASVGTTAVDYSVVIKLSTPDDETLDW